MHGFEIPWARRVLPVPWRPIQQQTLPWGQDPCEQLGVLQDGEKTKCFMEPTSWYINKTMELLLFCISAIVETTRSQSRCHNKIISCNLFYIVIRCQASHEALSPVLTTLSCTLPIICWRDCTIIYTLALYTAPPPLPDPDLTGDKHHNLMPDNKCSG